ncbi:response regulator [Paenibacillus sp. J22TS3]|uniref:response regulator transcription factor n=1 Tax=Paenibacillus sp. J22TS3 TaxID=2807192 RepID=UPI001B178BED|nr:response regulator [Paenibacillus sp. J22TS3]GIP21005.1 hypothetical protein J22TS3_12800 [Paenibacillus sp. J22TS3]
MHKVMLIDDDVPMLKVLQRMIKWEELDLKIVGTAYSSVKALHLFKESLPDIVITDIGLPQQNGIELASVFTQLKPETRVIFLTCHEDFHYAQQAIKLNADDYLLKDQLTPDQLTSSLKKSLGMIKLRTTGMDNEVLNHNKELLKQALWQRVLDGVGLDAAASYASRIGISWSYPCFMFGIVSIHFSSYVKYYQYSNLSVIRYAIGNIASELSASYEGITTFMGQDNNLIVLYNYRFNLVENTHQNFENYLQELRWQCERLIKVQLNTVTVKDKLELPAVGTWYERLSQTKYGFYEADSGKTDLNLDHFGPETYHPSPQGLLEPYQSELERVVLKNDPGEIHRIMRELEDTAKRSRIEPGEFIQEISLLLRSVELLFAKWRSDEEYYFYLSSARTLRDVAELVSHKLTRIAHERPKDTHAGVQEPKLQVIQQFIDQHLSENVTSIDIARYLYLNPSYFSRYFKRLTGINFTDYTHQYKMKLAAKMLKSSSQTLENLAAELGYSDRTYFSKVFKKYMGLTPSEYKAKYTPVKH